MEQQEYAALVALCWGINEMKCKRAIDIIGIPVEYPGGVVVRKGDRDEAIGRS
jgi:hypothetical protein